MCTYWTILVYYFPTKATLNLISVLLTMHLQISASNHSSRLKLGGNAEVRPPKTPDRSCNLKIKKTISQFLVKNEFFYSCNFNHICIPVIKVHSTRLNYVKLDFSNLWSKKCVVTWAYTETVKKNSQNITFQFLQSHSSFIKIQIYFRIWIKTLKLILQYI